MFKKENWCISCFETWTSGIGGKTFTIFPSIQFKSTNYGPNMDPRIKVYYRFIFEWLVWNFNCTYYIK